MIDNINFLGEKSCLTPEIEQALQTRRTDPDFHTLLTTLECYQWLQPEIVLAAAENTTQKPLMLTSILDVLHNPNTAFRYGDFLDRLHSWISRQGEHYQLTPPVVALFISGTPEAEEMIFRAPGTAPARLGQ